MRKLGLATLLFLGVFLVAALAYGDTAIYTGDSDTVKFPATMDDDGPAITYGPDTISFGADGGVGLPHEAFMGKGDFVYTMDLAMTDFDDVAGQYGQSIAVDFLPSGEFVELMFLNYDTANPSKYFWNQFLGTNWDQGDDANLGSNPGVGNTSMRISKSGGVVAISYKGISGEWIEMASVDLATTSVDPDSEWRLRLNNWGDAAYVYEVDELSIFIPSVDTETPVITLNGEKVIDIQVTLDDQTYVEEGATAEDLQDGDLTASIIVSGDVDTTVLGTYAVTYEVTDSDDNTGTASRFVTVMVVGLRAGIAVLGDPEPSINFGGPDYVDPGVLALDEEDGNITEDVMVGGDTVDPNTLGTYEITYTVTDSDGNPTRVSRPVTVADLEGPVITLNGDPFVEIDQGGAYTEAGATATDNLDDAVAVTAAIVTGGDVVDTATVGLYKVTYTVSDATGNETVASRTVAVLDITKPVIMVTGDAVLAISQWSVYTDAGATATDDIDVDLTVAVTGSVDKNVAGTYILTYTVTDAAGNEATPVTREVTVGPDVTAPVITLIGGTEMTMPQGGTYADEGATALDDVYGVLTEDIVIDSSAVDSSILGDYTVTLSITDGAGNTTQVTRTITVVPDTEAPEIVMIPVDKNNPEDIDVVLGIGSYYQDMGARASDNADGDMTDDVVTTGKDDVDTTVVGDYDITYTVTDAAGNTDEAIRTVTVVPPIVTGTVEDTSGNPLAGALVEFFVPLHDTYNLIDFDYLAETDDFKNSIIADSTDDFHKWRLETTTAADGTYGFTLDSDAPLNGWTVVVSMAGFAAATSANVDPGVDTLANFSGVSALVPRTGIASVTAQPGASKTVLTITCDCEAGFTSVADVTVKSGAGTVNATLSDGIITATYEGVDDFAVLISTGTAQLLYAYVADDTAELTTQGEIAFNGGSVVIEAEGGESAMVEVPTGGVASASSTVQIKQHPIEAITEANEGSPLYLYEITAFDNAKGAPLTDEQIKRVVITLPIDLSVVSQGDMEDGRYAVYRADSTSAFDIPGQALRVPADRILATDYAGDGLVGSVTFWTDALSVFGIGALRAELQDESADRSQAGCFVHTITDGQRPDGSAGSLFPVALIAGLMLIAALLNRVRGRSGKAIAGLAVLVASVFFIAGPADAEDGGYFVEVKGMFAFQDIVIDETVAKFTSAVPVDFDDSAGFQFAIGRTYSDYLSVKVELEYVISFDDQTDRGFQAWDRVDVLHGSVNVKLSPAWKKVKPYLVAGLGVMRAHEDILYHAESVSEVHSKTRDLGMSLRGGVGVDVFVTDSISIGLEGAYSSGLFDVDHVGYATVSVGVGYHF